MTPGKYICPIVNCKNALGVTGKHYFYQFTDEDNKLAAQIAEEQDANSGARGTRGAGQNKDYRLWGVLGEIAAARILQIDPQVRALAGPDRNPDIVTANGTQVEVKTGMPLEGKDKVNPDAVYMVGQFGPNGLIWHLKAITWGWRIPEFAESPPEYMTPRKGTNELNWRILDYSMGYPRPVE